MPPAYPPRILRHAEAIYYMGLGRTLFETQIRPTLAEIRIGERGIGYDIHELDDALDAWKQRNSIKGEKQTWPDAPDSHGTPRPAGAASEKSSEVRAYQSALKLALATKPKPSTTRS